MSNNVQQQALRQVRESYRSFRRAAARVLSFAVAILFSAKLCAQQVPALEQIQWKSETQIRELLGEPESIQGPTGTHASYVLWKYADFTVAFADQRATHVFQRDSLKSKRPPESE